MAGISPAFHSFQTPQGARALLPQASPHSLLPLPFPGARWFSFGGTKGRSKAQGCEEAVGHRWQGWGPGSVWEGLSLGRPCGAFLLHSHILHQPHTFPRVLILWCSSCRDVGEGSSADARKLQTDPNTHAIEFLLLWNRVETKPTALTERKPDLETTWYKILTKGEAASVRKVLLFCGSYLYSHSLMRMASGVKAPSLGAATLLKPAPEGSVSAPSHVSSAVPALLRYTLSSNSGAHRSRLGSTKDAPHRITKQTSNRKLPARANKTADWEPSLNWLVSMLDCKTFLR